MTGWRVVAVDCAGPELYTIPDVDQPCLLVFPADADGEALAGAVAAASGAAVLGRITSARRDGDTLIVSRNTHGGRLAIALSLDSGLAVATAHGLAEQDGQITLGASTELPQDSVPLSDQRISLESARIVIGGGRGLDEAGFDQLDRIADALGGAVAASLPAVDLGLAPVSRQVGQSGKFVTPEIYLAIGMSGTPQHMAGIGGTTRIIAVNKDPDAPIFGVAEAGAVADAKTLLPLLCAALETPDGDAA